MESAVARAGRRLWRQRVWLSVLWLACAGLWLAGAEAGLLALFAIAATALVAALPQAEPDAEARPLDRGEMPLPVSAADLSDALPDPVVLFRRDGAIIHANPAAVATFGGFVSHMPIMLKFRAPEMHGLIDAILSSGDAPEPIEYVEKLPVERLHRTYAVRVGDGGDLHALIFRDLSEMRRIDRMRADFIANASHEMRTPLASIAGFIETLRGPAKDDPKARAQFLEIMHAQATRMARLIDDMLSLSRLEMRSAIAPADRADISHVVDMVLESLSHQAREAGVELVKEAPASRVEVNGDHDELFQVLENLVENAIKYGGSGGRVVVSVEADVPPDHDVRVIVRDFGPGIEREHIPRVTERFYRVDVAAGRSQKGTGLGLAIVKHILTRHHAKLAIESVPGEGASFVVEFPPIGR